MKRLVLPLLAALALAACSTPTVFQPAASPGAVGYSELRIEPGRYRVFFRGGSGASPDQVMDLALMRAADLTLADGFDWFQVVDRFVTGSGGGSGPQVGLGVGGGSWGGSTATSVGVGTSFNLGGGPQLQAAIEITMGHGSKPPNLDAYDARAVRQNLGGRPPLG
jgi:hypothetical protein